MMELWLGNALIMPYPIENKDIPNKPARGALKCETTLLEPPKQNFQIFINLVGKTEHALKPF